MMIRYVCIGYLFFFLSSLWWEAIELCEYLEMGSVGVGVVGVGVGVVVNDNLQAAKHFGVKSR